MHYVERQPPPALGPHVECLWAVWDDEPSATRSPERIVPDGCPELIVHTGDAFARQDQAGRWKTQPRAFLAGTLTKPWTLRPGRRPRTVGIRFRPGAAARFLGVPMKDAADRETALGEIVGSRANDLADALGERRTIDGALDEAEGWMARRLRRVAAFERPARSAVALIMASGGRARVEDTARSLGWSRRRMERAFDHDLGISPKVFARIVRLSAVLARLDGAERDSAVDLALDSGYFDQSHLLRDFRELVGTAPRNVGASVGELSRQFIRPERLRALLAGG